MEPGAMIPINSTLDLCRKVDIEGSVAFQCTICIETSLGNVLSEFSSEMFPSTQNDHLDQSELTKMRAFLQDIVLRVKGGEVCCRSELGIDRSIVGHPKLYCPNG
jgi:hypothetical protein